MNSEFFEIHKTDSIEESIFVPKMSINIDYGTALVGRLKREYGDAVDEAFLNLLENFACPQNANEETPDIEKTSKAQLSNPIIGQFWYNTTNSQIYFWNGIEWKFVNPRGYYAANWRYNPTWTTNS